MDALSYLADGVFVFFTVLTLCIGIVTYQQPHNHNNKTLVALMALVLLTLAELFLIVAQARSLIPVRKGSSSLFLAIFALTASINISAFATRSMKGRGWHIFRVGYGIAAVIFALFVVIAYVYNL